MASTRKQKPKSRSMRLTDFFSQGDSADEAAPEKMPADVQEQMMAASGADGRGDSYPNTLPEVSQPGLLASTQQRKTTGLKRSTTAQASATASTTTAAAVLPEAEPPSPQSSTASPAKNRAKKDINTEADQHTLTHPNDELGLFPTSDQAVSQTVLKDMMLALRSSLQQSFTTALSSQQVAIDTLGERVDHVETKLAEFSTAHNELVDAHNNMEDEIRLLTTKLADIEDRNRRNNIKIRGIPESVSGPELIPYIQQVMTSLLKSSSKQDLILDRAHRLPKPKNVPASAPRDVIMRVHFFHVKEALMRISRDSALLPEPYQQLKFYADLSQFTIQARRKLTPVTSALRQHQVQYRWGFPTRLIIMRNGTTHVISTISEGISVLKTLGVPFSPPPPSEVSQTSKMPKEWKTMGPKH